MRLLSISETCAKASLHEVGTMGTPDYDAWLKEAGEALKKIALLMSIEAAP